MEFAVNYSPQAAELLAQGKITFDRFKLPAWLDVIATAKALHPVYVHFPLRVGMGTGDALDTETRQLPDWGKFEAILKDTNTPFINVHIAPITSDYPDIPSDTSDPAHTERLLEAVVRDVEGVARRFGAERVIIENDYYAPGKYFRATCTAEFVRRVIEATGCGLLLDIGHARLAARELGVDARDYLGAMPVQRIGEIHLAGIQVFDEHWQETLRQAGIAAETINQFAGRWQDHLPMTEDDWAFYGWTIEQLRSGAWQKPRMFSLEYGGVGALWQAITDADVLARDIPRLRGMLEEVLSK
jgi:uncharacterized protein (UPF0276 family)